MQAVKAYYDDGKFVPYEPVVIPKGSQVVVTILDFPIEEAQEDVSVRQKTAIASFRNTVRNSDPLPPEFDEVMSQRVNITRELDL